MTPRFRIFLDMDGVLVDFDRYMRERNVTAEVVKRVVGAYQCMQPIAGAIEGIRKLMSIAGQYGGEVWLATKPPTGIPHAYADKVQWVLENVSELARRVILTHDKGLLGGPGDYLVDDRPWRANCAAFRGTLIQFGVRESDAMHPGASIGVGGWVALVPMLHDMMRSRFAAADASISDINAARDLLRLGHLTPAEALNEVRQRESLAPLLDPLTQAGADAEVVPAIASRPAHGGYPGSVHSGAKPVGSGWFLDTADLLLAEHWLISPMPWGLRDGQTVVGRGMELFDLMEPGYETLRDLTTNQVRDVLRRRNSAQPA